MKRSSAAVLALLPAMLGAAACGDSSEPASASRDVTVEVPTEVPTGVLDAKALLETVRPSIALITTPVSQGSGVLVEGGYVVTNAHVVDPFDIATVAFEDEPAEDLPVVGVDPYADLALLGPVDLDHPPLALAAGIDVEQGDDVYLVGYPGEFDAVAVVAISAGLVSRLRDYQPFEQTFIQTDAAIGAGQSGGALVDGQGRVIGISGLSFGEQFALALGSPDVLASIAAIRDGEMPDYHPLADQPAVTSGVAEVSDEQDEQVIVLTASDEDRDLRLTVPDDSEPTISVSDLVGDLYQVNQRLIDQALASDPSLAAADIGDLVESDRRDGYTIHIPGGTDVVIGLGTTRLGGATVAFSSNLPLVTYDDSDDPRPIALGETALGVIDAYELDDVYELELEEGDTVTVRVSAGGGDPVFGIQPPGTDRADVEPVDDSGLGLYGLDAEDTFTAEATGTYTIRVSINEYLVTGYRLDVETG